MTSSSAPTGADDDRGTTYDTKATRGGAALEKGDGNEHGPPALNSAPGSKPSSFEYRAARRAERFKRDFMECGNGGANTAVERRATASRRKATRRGAALGQGAGGDVELSVAEEVGHARNKGSGHSASGAESADIERGNGGVTAAFERSDVGAQAEGGRRDGRRRNRALLGGEPGGPASVPGRSVSGDTGNPLRGGGTFVLGRPIEETVGNQRRERQSSLAANTETTAHGGAAPEQGEGGDVELSVAEDVGHARCEASGHSARAREVRTWSAGTAVRRPPQNAET